MAPSQKRTYHHEVSQTTIETYLHCFYGVGNAPTKYLNSKYGETKLSTPCIIPLEHEMSGLTIFASLILNPTTSPVPNKPDRSGLIDTGNNARVSIWGNSLIYISDGIIGSNIIYE